jgi:catalase
VVPGIDFSNDPLLAGRIHSYVDTQITRLGGPNFHEIPINSPVAPVHNNQRDGLHRQAIHRGRVAYEPNSLAGGCPHQMGAQGFQSFAEKLQKSRAPADKVRGRPEKFAEHYLQATLFYESQTAVEQAHIVGGFRFELSKVTVPAIRHRMLASLRNVSEDLASRVAEGLGMDLPDALPPALERAPRPEVKKSPALSLRFRPGDTGIRGLRVAILVADGVESRSLAQVQEALFEGGAVPRLVGVRLGKAVGNDGTSWMPDATIENTPAVLFDALVVPGGQDAALGLAIDARTEEFVRLQYRHCKTLLAIGEGAALLESAGVGKPDPGLLIAKANEVAAVLPRFLEALTRQRHDERDRDPPPR